METVIVKLVLFEIGVGVDARADVLAPTNPWASALYLCECLIGERFCPSLASVAV